MPPWRSRVRTVGKQARWLLEVRIMMNRLFALALLAAPFATGCFIEGDATLEVRNNSGYTIDEIYLTDVGSSSWGSDELRGDSLFPGESLVLGVGCGYYDALLVDETGTECTVYDLDLCLNDAVWVINNSTCNVFGAKKTPETTTPSATPAVEAAR